MSCVLTSALGEHAGDDGLAVHTTPLMACFPSPSGKRLGEIDLAQPRLINVLQTRPKEGHGRQAQNWVIWPLGTDILMT